MIRASYERLAARYGPQHWWPAEHAFEIMVGAVLVQRTSWTNAARAVAALRTAGLLEWRALAAAEEHALRERVRAAGFHNSKARRLIGVARFVRSAGGIDPLAAVETQELRKRLLNLDGIGRETADAILLYAFGRPVAVIDAYLRRWHTRMGGLQVDDDLLRTNVEGALPTRSELNEFHALMVEHGKRHCRAQAVCKDCCLREECAYGCR